MKGCKNKGRFSQYCQGAGLYDPSKSRSSKNLKKMFHIRYDLGDSVGFIYEDIFAFGDPRVEQLKLKFPVKFGAAIQTTDGDQVSF
jgi:hypothetical protein